MKCCLVYLSGMRHFKCSFSTLLFAQIPKSLSKFEEKIVFNSISA